MGDRVTQRDDVIEFRTEFLKCYDTMSFNVGRAMGTIDKLLDENEKLQTQLSNALDTIRTLQDAVNGFQKDIC